ncbi:hypothetical protein ASPTUDRAFT_50671 [Aspergillus tubingensis CBS 134.48]|uniref:Uncharacterized protein n=1 Tax=Aspergillus tubingensis (strain CBS 134.48) TaxID=767770 RepID=A0A1L9NHG9_ASPTC|nr:hypothetical protein ASPTUDRAFT_50671 [Aspergillus tubingensis CBS 134.48]
MQMLPPRELVALDAIGSRSLLEDPLSFYFLVFTFFGALDVMATSAAQILILIPFLLLLNENCHNLSPVVPTLGRAAVTVSSP